MYYDIMPLILNHYKNAKVIWDSKSPIIKKCYTHNIMIYHNNVYLRWSLKINILNPNFKQLNCYNVYNSYEYAAKQIYEAYVPPYCTTFHNHKSIDKYIKQKHNITSIEIINCLKDIEDENTRYQLQIYIENIMNQWNVESPCVYYDNEILPTCPYDHIEAFISTLREEKLFNLLFV